MTISKRLFCAVILSALASPGFAQSTFLEQIRRTGMTQEDINIMAQTASTLYVGRSAVVGSQTEWSNPATGAFGTAKIAGVQGSCVDLDYVFHTKTRPDARSLQLRRCKQGDKWVLSN